MPLTASQEQSVQEASSSLTVILAFAVGATLGGFLLWLFLSRQLKFIESKFFALNGDFLRLSEEKARLQATLPQVQSQMNEAKAQASQFANTLEELRVQNASLQKATSGLETERQLLLQQERDLRQQILDLQEFFEDQKKQTRVEFENLAQSILEAKTKVFAESSEKNLTVLLGPLKERLLTFEKSVEEKYSSEAKDRHALKSEIERLILLNDKMTQETTSLTQALRGDSKFQGDWGELVLETVLESSGLREGHEYVLQRSLLNDDGDRMRPDVLITLPDEKHIVVDSKVSLKAYDLFHNASDEGFRKKALGDHLKSLEKHIEELSSKHYSKLKGLRSPEVVFLFVPIEPAYLLAMSHDPDLSSRAWKKGVALVTATTLLTSLKTVASIWKLEKQNKNALEIAEEGGKLYDKFVGFMEDFEKVGATFETGQNHFKNAMGKLRDGKGNVFRKMEQLRELGAAPSKRLDSKHLE